MFERPYQFPGGSTGIDSAARTAILNQQLLDSTPDNIMRGPGGSLLTVTKERGGNAIVRAPDGSFLPNIRSGDPGFIDSLTHGGLVARDRDASYGYAIAGHPAMDMWISQLGSMDAEAGMGPRLARLGGAATGDTVNAWVGQAEALGPRR